LNLDKVLDQKINKWKKIYDIWDVHAKGMNGKKSFEEIRGEPSKLIA
jgi:hypothetical protein